MRVRKTIVLVEYRSSSAAGNPRYTVHFSDGTTILTEPDAAVGYSIPNSEYQNVPVVITLNERGRIIGVETE